MDTKYNGWTNYETWCVNLWLTNDQGSDEMMREWAQEAYNNAVADKYNTRKENAARNLETLIKDFIEEESPAQEANVYGDLMGHALSSVDWLEIAESFLEDVTEEEE